MPTLSSVMTALSSKGRESTRKIYSRHGMPLDRVLGVSAADMKLIAKTVKGQQALALELYATGIMESMYLAGMIADGSKMSRKQLNDWAERADGMQMIAEYTVPWVTVESEHTCDLAVEWIGSKKESVAAAGWCTYAGLISMKPDDELDQKEIEGLLERIAKEIGKSRNRVKYTMNGFVIAVGSFVKPLARQAKAVAKQIGAVEVNMGETACKVPLATEYIAKVEAAGRVGRKRKTIRC
jgi:3-methyladenine DNA glycosylase AlkD